MTDFLRICKRVGENTAREGNDWGENVRCLAFTSDCICLEWRVLVTMQGLALTIQISSLSFSTIYCALRGYTAWTALVGYLVLRLQLGFEQWEHLQCSSEGERKNYSSSFYTVALCHKMNVSFV